MDVVETGFKRLLGKARTLVTSVEPAVKRVYSHDAEDVLTSFKCGMKEIVREDKWDKQFGVSGCHHLTVGMFYLGNVGDFRVCLAFRLYSLVYWPCYR